MSKLGTSLRNSITAEKQSVAQKDLQVKPAVTKVIKKASSKANTPTKLTIKKPVLAKSVATTKNKKPLAKLTQQSTVEKAVSVKQVPSTQPNNNSVVIKNPVDILVFVNQSLVQATKNRQEYLKQLSLMVQNWQDMFGNILQSQIYRQQQTVQNMLSSLYNPFLPKA